MTGLLEKAIDKIRILPEAEQEAIAALILEKLPAGHQGDIAYRRSRERNRVDRCSETSEFTAQEATPENSEQICEYIKELIENSCVTEARRLVSDIRPGVSEELDYWKKVLALPVARVTKPLADTDPKKDMLWIEKNADNYKGRWVALKNGELIGSHESYIELHRTLKQSGRITGSFFFRIGN